MRCTLSNVNYAPKIGSSDFALSGCEWWPTLTISWNILFQLTSPKSIFSLCEIRQNYLIVKGGHFHHIKRNNILRDVVDHHLRLISPKLNDPVLESSWHCIIVLYLNYCATSTIFVILPHFAHKLNLFEILLKYFIIVKVMNKYSTSNWREEFIFLNEWAHFYLAQISTKIVVVMFSIIS